MTSQDTWISSKIDRSESFICEMVEKYNPVKIYVCYSGGNDSMVSSHLLMEMFGLNKWSHLCEVLHIDTGIGIQATKDHVKNVCSSFGWPLTIIKAEDCGQYYDDIVIKHGFPGPKSHRYMYSFLKERAIREATRRAKNNRNDKVFFVSGVYKGESKRRSGYSSPVTVNRSQVWVAPCFFWGKTDFYNYAQNTDLPKSQVFKILGISGECCCGAFASKGEKERIKLLDVDLYNRINKLEGLTAFPWGYEDPGPSIQYQMEQKGQLSFMPMCVGCGKTTSSEDF